MLHDFAVSAFWPGVEPVGPGQLRDPGLLNSAVSRPFQNVFGVEVHDSFAKKTAALFHSLISNHPFQNGNKRTAVVALGYFLIANGHFPALKPSEMYDLAIATATYSERGVTDDEILMEIADAVNDLAVPFRVMRQRADQRKMYRWGLKTRLSIRRHPLNQEQPPQ